MFLLTEELLHLYQEDGQSIKRLGRLHGSHLVLARSPIGTIFFTVGWMQALTYLRKEKKCKESIV